MPSERTKRAGVFLALCAGQEPSAIADFFKIPKSLVYRIKQTYDQFDGPEEEREAFCVERKTREAKRPVRDATFVEEVQAIVEANPRTLGCVLEIRTNFKGF